MTDKPAKIIEFSPNGNRYTQETVDLCYQVWSLKAGRSPTKTRRLLENEEWRKSVGIALYEDLPDRTTIEYWSKQYNWIQRFHDDIEATGGAILYQAKAEVILGTGEAAALLRDAVNDEGANLKDRIKAAELLMSYGMGKDSGLAVQSKPRGEADVDPAQLEAMSTEDLLKFARAAEDRRRKAG